MHVCVDGWAAKPAAPRQPEEGNMPRFHTENRPPHALHPSLTHHGRWSCSFAIHFVVREVNVMQIVSAIFILLIFKGAGGTHYSSS